MQHAQPKEYVQSQSKGQNILYQLFVQKYNEMREDIRTRKTFTMLSNTKSLKIRTDKIEIPDINSIASSHFKAQDKRLLIDLFVNDENIQSICDDVLGRMNVNSQDLSNVDMLQYLNTDNNAPATIDAQGNVQRRAVSLSNTQSSHIPQVGLP